jgi:hypothetical protein
VNAPADFRVAYLPGAADDVPKMLGQVGLDVALVPNGALGGTGLSEFDAVVIGARAYEVREDVYAYHEDLMEYVRAGGTLLVQYQQYAFSDKQPVPYSMKIGRPHERVTDETAPVQILDPAHPIFNAPNKIASADFEGWVQERGLYFWSEWDERYRPLLACADPGEDPQRGALLIAPIGQGHYIYTGLAFHRQLPAGVPGAARLLVNLVSVGMD